MHESSLDPARAVVALRPITNGPADESVASMLALLQDHLKLVREGQLRSLAVVSVSADGSAIGTQWSCAHADRKSTRLNSSHANISYAVFCLKKKNNN